MKHISIWGDMSNKIWGEGNPQLEKPLHLEKGQFDVVFGTEVLLVPIFSRTKTTVQ